MDEWQNKINIVLSRGYSQHQYAHATGMSQKTVSRIVRGEADGSKYADNINDALATLPQRPRRAKRKLQTQKTSTALIPSPRVQLIAAQLRAQQKNMYRIQEMKSPARPTVFIPQQAVSLQPGQPLLSQPGSAIEYYASYRLDPWPIGVPVNYLTPLEHHIKLAWGKLKRQ